MPDAADGVYLGVDVGTSATRVSLVRPGGHAVVASAGYRTVQAGTAGSSRTRRPGRGRWPRHCAGLSRMALT